ncbi:cobyrinate a,c-diamide synthase [Thiohalophilus sp.]|uniref:cobyrinate a,c-diamide synthase n=1 Tax=Thiohalophilus sp. TaxID=3028392 RepID=UPI002ACEB358|nr:cobyrinate a,c-diamide synthase [Thiohalophilus sp.]MDZ7662864.1 cobyrinate a,c-diamide synthase [Thiohalophilus sp.]
MNRLLISAAHKSSGKTTLSIGLCAAFRQRGLDVRPFKKGPDYIDPMWLGQAAGHPCHNLDFYTMSRDEILQTLQQQAGASDLALIEANKGLYDGLDIEGSNSNAALARLTETPVILVIDVQGMTRGIAPLILGYQAFDPQVNIAGVILNQIRGSRHEAKLRAVIEHYTHLPVVGAVYHDTRLAITERHLGLIPSNENTEATGKIEAIGQLIAQQVDLDRLQTLARQAPALPASELPTAPAPVRPPDIRLGIARDEAFGFYYPGDLEALQQAGAELVPIDTLHDRQLPAIDGLFIGGGFPESRLTELAANQPLREAIHSAIEGGLPAYAECGGLMYLCRQIRWQGETAPMVGVIPADVVMHSRPQGRGYVRLRETDESPWATAAPADPQAEFPAHEFHYSALENLAQPQRFAYRVLRGTGIDGEHDGLIHKNLLACYAHQRDTARHHWARRFIDFVRRTRENGIDV